MKKALVSTIEPRFSGYRVAQVEQSENTFNVSDQLIWVECPDDVVADLFWYDPESKTFVAISQEVVQSPVTIEQIQTQMLELQNQLASLIAAQSTQA